MKIIAIYLRGHLKSNLRWKSRSTEEDGDDFEYRPEQEINKKKRIQGKFPVY